MRENIIANFDFLEKLKLFQKHLTDPKYFDLLAQRGLDPTTKEKFDETKNLFNYIDRELISIDELLHDKNKNKQV